MWNVCACFSGEIQALAGVPETAATSISVASLVGDTSVPPLSIPCIKLKKKKKKFWIIHEALSSNLPL